MSNVLRGNFGNHSPEIHFEPTNPDSAGGSDTDTGTDRALPEVVIIPNLESSQYGYLNDCAEADRVTASVLAVVAKRLSSTSRKQE